MFQFNVNDISKYRTQLMGIATLLVIFGHSVGNGVVMPRWMESLCGLASVGVDIFLLVSIGLVPDSCTTPFSVEKELVKNIPEKLIPIAHHWLILHGRYVCQARTPKCDTCGLQMMCKYFCNTYKVTKEEPKAKNK